MLPTSMSSKMSSSYPRWIFITVPFLVLLHQGSWLWRDARLVLGFPVNLLYHVALSLLVSAIMLLVVLFAWPRYLNKD